ncbi:alpha/beta hydrolase [Floridanema evergladense]|uniref:Alpha/beta hydrolase n=1 Tax=Floridaenema evergladense BLCC-F167 TaxID=3153639 RepID=A0ABV4WW13_9CYAN
MNKRMLDKHLANIQKQFRKLMGYGFFFPLLGTCSLVFTLTALPGRAADRIYFNYGPLDFSISVDSLENFAKEGKVDSELAFILNRLNPEQKAQLHDLLNSRYQFNSVLMSRFFYSSFGERFLTYLGELIQVEGGQNGLYGIRSALILSTADSDGLSLINFLRKFPTNMRLNTKRILQQFQEVSALQEETKAFVTAIERTNTQVKKSDSSIDFSQLPDLKEPGKYSYTKQVKTLRDASRQREFIVELYLPEVPNGEKIPVVVISNGIGTKLDRYDYLAQHLASHGFAVAIPQHPDSDDIQQQAFFQGLSPQMFKTTAYINRPLDVSYMLDELDRLNSSEFKGQLNLQQVGLFGNSFGGDTALSLAGAQINFDQLKKDCTPEKNLVKLSLLIHCQALELPEKTYNFRDNRIKAVSVLFPGSSSLYGEAGLSKINIPVLWGAVDKDIFSPLLIEQAPAFSWLKTKEKYLIIATKLDHLNLNFSALSSIASPDREVADKVTIKEPEVAKSYLKALNLAFFRAYLTNDSNYLPYLSAAYAQAISEDPYNLILLRSIDQRLLRKTSN